MITLANAPVPYGAFGLSRPDLVGIPSGADLRQLVQAAGYRGIDLGAHGLLGTWQELVDNLVARGLWLCGGWLDFPFAGSNQDFEAALAAASPVLDDFSLVAASQSGPAPLPTIADSGSAERRAEPGGAPSLAWPGDRWRVFVDRIEQVGRLVRARGLEPTLHHHVATYIETPSEIEPFLQDTSTDLTSDSGHLLLGQGDLELEELLQDIVDGLDGWLVVEQDVVVELSPSRLETLSHRYGVARTGCFATVGELAVAVHDGRLTEDAAIIATTGDRVDDALAPAASV